MGTIPDIDSMVGTLGQTLESGNRLNQKGIEVVLERTRSFLARNQDIDTEAEVASAMKDFHQLLSRELMEGWTDYGIEDGATADSVMEMVTNNVHSYLKREAHLS